MFKNIKKFFKLKYEYKILIVETVFFLSIAQIAIKTVSFKKIAKILGRLENVRDKKTESVFDDFELQQVKKISKAINMSSRNLFWQSKCLAQALAAKMILKRRKIKSRVYLGVLKDDGEKIKAHAWIESCGIIVTGDNGIKKYNIISVFYN